MVNSSSPAADGSQRENFCPWRMKWSGESTPPWCVVFLVTLRVGWIVAQRKAKLKGNWVGSAVQHFR
jgi:hypothetical protein